ncbi:hypothetical protein [Rhizobacter sp. Root1221]|uniref:hypothetical protein n=1 Tax=Rhizobacter sp. Root1221 TaxID=1736433 RepID=UPI0006F4AD46|nr:hypothetical protein [Rhizobacter sp. Root1221]KQV99240.1 hypothetical protein ASC87_20840 [Rhizobacter sp. Root1221]
MIRIAALAAAFALTSVSALAQQAATPAAAKPAAAKPAAAKAAKPAKGKKAAPAPKALAPADQTQLMAAERVYFGDYECDFKQTLQIAMNPKNAGYVDVAFKKGVYTMKPILSSTGALRLEDVTGRTLLIQIANKSMLMDVKAGQRLVDDCVHEKQRESSQAVKAQQTN